MKRNVASRVEIRPVLSRHTLDDFRRPQEQETVMELRKRAISRWLQQFPMEEGSFEKPTTIWTSSRLLEDKVLSSIKQKKGAANHNLDEELEECPAALMEKKSQPSESELSIRPMQSTRHLLSMKHSFNNGSGTSCYPVQNENRNTNKITRSASIDSALRSDYNTTMTKTSSAEEMCNSAEKNGHWSVMSERIDDSPKEDTAYNGSSKELENQSRVHKNSEELFHVKYKVPSRALHPPANQRMELRTHRNTNTLTPQSKVPKGDWWVPNVCFATSEEAVDQCSVHSFKPLSESEETFIRGVPDRIQSRLHKGQKPNKRYPSLQRILKRMREAERRVRFKRMKLICELEHPFHMKRMLDHSRKLNLTISLPPEIPIMEYNAPASLADLSDFECYMGPLFSSLFFHGELITQPSLRHCQNWVFDKLLCFLTSTARSYTSDQPN
eukprot:g1516.t1